MPMTLCQGMTGCRSRNAWETVAAASPMIWIQRIVAAAARKSLHYGAHERRRQRHHA